MAEGAHRITAEFEERLCDYTGAPYTVAVDNCSNAIFLALKYWSIGKFPHAITIPKHTYPAVPCEIIHADMAVRFRDSLPGLTGSYNLWPTNIYDCALRFTADMYQSGMIMCLSFTGPFKHLKLGKGGAILTDDRKAYEWFKRARFSGRRECSYLEDDFDMLGWNFYMMPEVAARGLLLMDQFYDENGKKVNKDICHRYPDLSKYPIYGG